MTVVSAIIPCYNYGRFLKQCVQSVLSQNGVDVRVLVIDDCSADETPQVAAELVAADSRVSCVRHAQNLGHILTYNEGLQWATGDYTLLLSADDLLTCGALARITRLLDQHPEVGFAFGKNIRISDSTSLPPPAIGTGDSGWQIWDGQEWLKSVCRERETFIDSPEVVVRTHMYKKFGGYRKDLPHTADVEMWLRLAAHCAVGRVDADQAYYRVHGRNMHSDLAPTALHSLQHWKAAFDVFFGGQGEHIDDCSRVQDFAAASLAALALDAAYSGRDSRDRPVCQQLIEFATRTYPSVCSVGGSYRLGYTSNRTVAEWATRTLLGAPLYLYRRLAEDTFRCLRLMFSGNLTGAAYEIGKMAAHTHLIWGSIVRRPMGRHESGARTRIGSPGY